MTYREAQPTDSVSTPAATPVRWYVATKVPPFRDARVTAQHAREAWEKANLGPAFVDCYIRQVNS